MSSVVGYGAYGSASVLATEQYESSPLIIDPYAIRLLPPALHLKALATRRAPVRRAMIAATEKKICGGWAGVLCRKRYIDEQLIDALADGLDAVIILGGGFDTRLYRIPQLAGVPVWEVDLPANSIRKQQVAARRFGYIPRHATYVAADLATEDMTKRLSDSGFDLDMRAFVIWEAVSMYLAEATVRRTLRHMLALAPGSRLAFTFLRKAFVDGFAMYGARAGYDEFVTQQQLWHFGLHPERVAEFLAEYDWDLLLHVGAAEYLQRYLRPAHRDLPVSEIERAVIVQR